MSYDYYVTAEKITWGQQKLILTTDIIYIGGGDYDLLTAEWKELVFR